MKSTPQLFDTFIWHVFGSRWLWRQRLCRLLEHIALHIAWIDASAKALVLIVSPRFYCQVFTRMRKSILFTETAISWDVLGPVLFVRYYHWLLAILHHCLSSDPARGMFESYQWLGFRRWTYLGSTVSSDTYNWLLKNWSDLVEMTITLDLKFIFWRRFNCDLLTCSQIIPEWFTDTFKVVSSHCCQEATDDLATPHLIRK